MNQTSYLLSALLLTVSAAAAAQNTQTAPTPATQHGASAADQTSGGASAGASSPSGPTLMQKREKGMAPDGKTGVNGKATGKMKQN